MSDLRSGKPEVKIKILNKKSSMLLVRGIAWIDGIEVPFTAYRPRSVMDIHCDEWFRNQVTVRTKRGIIKEFAEADYIRNKMRDAAKGWWIDKRYWR